MDRSTNRPPLFSVLCYLATAAFIVLGLLHDTIYLSAAFLCLAGSATKTRYERFAFVAVSLVMLLLVMAYGLGRQLALEDNTRCGVTSECRDA